MSRGTVPRAQPVLASERLTLAPLVPGHTEGLVALFADPRASRYFPVDFSDERAARDLVAGRLAYAGPPQLGYWTWLLDGQVVGLGHLQPARDLPSRLIETGWCVRPDLWRQGLATEAIGALLDYALSGLRLPAVWALVDSGNTPSIGFAHRLGFLSVGERRLDDGVAQVFVRTADHSL
ncbi:GNAT family N-acetyltransferase [Streptomyces sp. NBC_01622]|uniref:GNAT family N-acetyltransferase n=1 Tax=Streptomyces sp. NBC_01622 TaxID=2975903 RepID=UPI003867EFE8|nr:GNAT family N-acetyltransferase [Streptomyces sp. NBC_01622]